MVVLVLGYALPETRCVLKAGGTKRYPKYPTIYLANLLNSPKTFGVCMLEKKPLLGVRSTY